MKLICKECESELEFTDLHEDGTEILIKPCEECLNAASDKGYDAGYEEGYKEGYADGKKEMEAEMDKLEDEIEELKNA
jgi:flagellar biosynthesis/type III secretory pathway protein FliH